MLIYLAHLLSLNCTYALTRGRYDYAILLVPMTRALNSCFLYFKDGITKATEKFQAGAREFMDRLSRVNKSKYVSSMASCYLLCFTTSELSQLTILLLYYMLTL